MKIQAIHDVICVGKFPTSDAWQRACIEVEDAIASTDWPWGSGTFTIHPEEKGNGVTPIKVPCMKHLKSSGWQIECLPTVMREILGPKDLDALRIGDDHAIAFEWETGNISSSHRAVNKIVYAIGNGCIQGGFLVLPSRALYGYLTDRIGNVDEIIPYFDFWRAFPVANGALRVIAVEQDREDFTTPAIPKGQDGNSLARRALGLNKQTTRGKKRGKKHKRKATAAQRSPRTGDDVDPLFLAARQ